MNNMKSTIPSTHLTPDNYLMCPRCKNDKRFSVLIQYKVEDGIPNPSGTTSMDDLSTWSDYNTVVCEQCYFYLTWGGAKWREVEAFNLKKSIGVIEEESSREELLQSIPIELLEQMLKEKGGVSG